MTAAVPPPSAALPGPPTLLYMTNLHLKFVAEALDNGVAARCRIFEKWGAKRGVDDVGHHRGGGKPGEIE